MATIGKALLKPFTALSPKAGDSPQKPGNARKGPEIAPDGDLATITQSDAPGSQSAQNYETLKEEEVVFSAPTVQTTEANGVKTTLHIPAGSKKTSRESHKVGQVLGAAQKPSETGTILASFKWVQGLGVLALLVGAIGFAHPAARLLIGGKDTAVVIGLIGVGMIAGPFLLVQYADWFALGILAAAAYWFWSRSKFKEAKLDALTQK